MDIDVKYHPSRFLMKAGVITSHVADILGSLKVTDTEDGERSMNAIKQALGKKSKRLPMAHLCVSLMSQRSKSPALRALHRRRKAIAVSAPPPPRAHS